jgi:hypothetical protein
MNDWASLDSHFEEAVGAIGAGEVEALERHITAGKRGY